MSPFQYIHGYHHQAKHVFEGTNFKSDDVMAEGVKKIYSTQTVKYGFLRELLIHFEEVQYHSQKNNEVLSCRKEKTKNSVYDNAGTQIAGLLFLHSYFSHAFIEAKI